MAVACFPRVVAVVARCSAPEVPVGKQIVYRFGPPPFFLISGEVGTGFSDIREHRAHTDRTAGMRGCIATTASFEPEPPIYLRIPARRQGIQQGSDVVIREKHAAARGFLGQQKSGLRRGAQPHETAASRMCAAKVAGIEKRALRDCRAPQRSGTHLYAVAAELGNAYA